MITFMRISTKREYERNERNLVRRITALESENSSLFRSVENSERAFSEGVASIAESLSALAAHFTPLVEESDPVWIRTKDIKTGQSIPTIKVSVSDDGKYVQPSVTVPMNDSGTFVLHPFPVANPNNVISEVVAPTTDGPNYTPWDL